MSFRERSAWISFVSILLVFGTYFWNVIRVLRGWVEYREVFNTEVGLLVAFVLLEVVALAVYAPSEALAPKDERESLIEMRATRVAFQVLVVGALAGVGAMHLTACVWVVAHCVLFAVVVAELVKFGVQMHHFRGRRRRVPMHEQFAGNIHQAGGRRSRVIDRRTTSPRTRRSSVSGSLETCSAGPS